MKKIQLAKNKETYDVLVLSDLQIEYQDKRSINATLEYAATKDWDEVIQVGDFMDFDFISRYTKADLKLLSSRSFKKSYKEGNEFLDQLREATEDAPLTILQGNHDYRVVPVIQAMPTLEGLIEPEVNLNFDERGIDYVKFWEDGTVYSVGHANFIHGLYVNEHHAKKHVERYGANIFYGHTHDVQTFSKELWGDDKTIVGQSLGCLCRYDQSYMAGKPSRWQQAFAEFNFRSNGLFNYNVIRIFNHAFIGPDGVIYQG